MNSIFGSTLSLNGLLNDTLFGCGAGDEFLRDLEDAASEPFAELGFPKETKTSGASSRASSHSGVGYDAVSDTAETFPSSTPALRNGSDYQLPLAYQVPTPVALATSTPNLSEPRSHASESLPVDNSALLGQLLATISTSSQQAGALKKEVPAVSTQVESARPAQSAANLTLPSLTAQQQHALQTIMNLGSLGSTPEGKKVRRMLSNRESARRSRHRKQAHMHELEDKVHGIEAENQALKMSLAKANEQELQHKTECMRLHAEIAALRARVMQLDHRCTCGLQDKSGSHTADGGDAGSFDSCCVSALKRPLSEAGNFEDVSKRQRC